MTVICLKNLTREVPLVKSDIVLKRATAEDGESLTLYEQIWNVHTTVPIFLILIIGPLVNFESATFFTKFNSLGKV